MPPRMFHRMFHRMRAQVGMVPARPAQHPPAPHPAAVPSATASPTGTSPICGLKLARECWNAYGKPLIADNTRISGAHRGGTGGPRIGMLRVR